MDRRNEVDVDEKYVGADTVPPAKDEKEKFTFFWQSRSPFSQWYIAKFEVDGVVYNCAEQFMMHQKAVTFNDSQSAKQIMATQSPMQQKKLGRHVNGYDDKIWNAVCKDIVKKGNRAKFSQNRSLKDELFSTVGTTLVEASPVDNKWGIGLDAKNPLAKDRKTWKGSNLLGECLTEVRDELMQQEALQQESSVNEDQSELTNDLNADATLSPDNNAEEHTPASNKRKRSSEEPHSDGGDNKRMATDNRKQSESEGSDVE